MKGLIFNAFFEMVEQSAGDEMLENVIDGAQLPHLGSYTAAGNYPDSELFSLLAQLQEQTGMEMPVLLETFGTHVFHFLHRGYAHFFQEASGAFDLLASMPSHFSEKIKKLYPDALLPHFLVEERSAQKMVLLYDSPRAWGAFAKGLIQAACSYYQDQCLIEEAAVDGNPHQVRFTITMV
ncbi:MAG: heme NO-binding domain-containing protein [Haliscomenobacter sp.]|nr:heme NO-binding domain-containing protein [Haliscomenobacter sp.]MBK8654052.1 heme NO-binding domain-containing protein [Haliscomenobacter sp.]MBP9076569.1 heme NO-binding domain-containing protein [Haliscomenobacter sp.]